LLFEPFVVCFAVALFVVDEGGRVLYKLFPAAAKHGKLILMEESQLPSEDEGLPDNHLESSISPIEPVNTSEIIRARSGHL
jgi:hypothetical protein